MGEDNYHGHDKWRIKNFMGSGHKYAEFSCRPIAVLQSFEPALTPNDIALSCFVLTSLQLPGNKQKHTFVSPGSKCRWPQKATRIVLDLVKNAESNAEVGA